MPIFLATLVPALITWGRNALAVYGLSRLFSETPVQELEDMVIGWIVGQVAARAGLVLDPADPFGDASMANAVAQKTGIPLRSLKDRAMIAEDIDSYAAERVSNAIGFKISTLKDPARAKSDFRTAALAVITERTGVPFGSLGGDASPEDIKIAVEDWARARFVTGLMSDAAAALENLSGPGADFESVAQAMNSKLEAAGSINRVTASKLALEVAEGLVSGSVARYHATALSVSKKERRSLQVRAAQQKFRSLHGNRQKYVPLGMAANIG